MSDTDDCCAAIILALVTEKRKVKRKRKQRVWVKSWLQIAVVNANYKFIIVDIGTMEEFPMGVCSPKQNFIGDSWITNFNTNRNGQGDKTTIPHPQQNRSCRPYFSAWQFTWQWNETIRPRRLSARGSGFLLRKNGADQPRLNSVVQFGRTHWKW